MTRSPLRRAPPVPVPDAPPLRPPVSHWPRGDERIAVWASAISLTSRPHTARTSARTHRRPNPDGSTRRPPIIDATAPPALPVRALARPPIRRYRCRCRCRRVSSDHRHSSCHGGLRATAAIGTVLYLSIMLLGQHTTSAGCRAGNATIIEHRPAFRSNHVVCNAHFLRTPSRQLAATTRPPCRCMNAIRHLGATLPLHRPPPFAHSYYHRPRPRRMVVIGFGVPRRLRVALLSARPPARRRAACALGAQLQACFHRRLASQAVNRLRPAAVVVSFIASLCMRLRSRIGCRSPLFPFPLPCACCVRPEPSLFWFAPSARAGIACCAAD